MPSVSFRLEPIPASAGIARGMVGAFLARVGQRDATPAARLIVSELVTNAIVHTRRPVELQLIYTDEDHILRGGVVDASPLVPPVPAHDDAIDDQRGLFLVDRVATAWGTFADQDGKVVCFELRTDTADALHTEQTPDTS